MVDQKHLPDKLCFKCSDALLSAVQIRSICIESEKLLRKKLSDLITLQTETSEPEINEKPREEIPQACNATREASFSSNDDHNFEDIAIPKSKQASYCPPSYKMKKINVPCEICGKKYKRSYIMTHLKTHKDEDKTKGFNCKNTDFLYLKYLIDFNR